MFGFTWCNIENVICIWMQCLKIIRLKRLQASFCSWYSKSIWRILSLFFIFIISCSLFTIFITNWTHLTILLWANLQIQFRKTFMNICTIHFYAIIQRVINIRLIQSIEHNVRVYSLKINNTFNESFLFSFSITIPNLPGVLAKHWKSNRSLLEHFKLPPVFYVVDLRAWEQFFSNTMGCALRICFIFLQMSSVYHYFCFP